MAAIDEFVPQFSEVARAEEAILSARLASVRAAISHPGEKGHSLEHHVIQLLREMLPSEYGLSTGFVAWHAPDGPRLSGQLDVIIYDAVRTAPIARLGAVEVFPIEGVYGYVEVKASLLSVADGERDGWPSNSIEYCVEQNVRIRKMRERRFWERTDVAKTVLVRKEWLGLRAYVIAFAASGAVASDAEALAKRIANLAKRSQAHLHGVFIAERAFLSVNAHDPKKAKEEEKYQVFFTERNTLAALKSQLLQALGSFPRFPSDWVPAIDQYYASDPDWHVARPEEG